MGSSVDGICVTPVDVDESNGEETSFATLSIEQIFLVTRPRQSRVLSSAPSHIFGRISIGPSG